MKRIIALLFAIALPQVVLAGANVSLSAAGYESRMDTIYPTLGLAVDQKILGPLHLVSWVGTGLRPTEDLQNDKAFIGGKLGLDYRVDGYSAGLGAAMGRSDDSVSDVIFQGSFVEKSIYVKVGYKLW